MEYVCTKLLLYDVCTYRYYSLEHFGSYQSLGLSKYFCLYWRLTRLNHYHYILYKKTGQVRVGLAHEGFRTIDYI